jgi:hypothetical protein
VREVKVASEPEALLQVLENPIYGFRRIGPRQPSELGMNIAVYEARGGVTLRYTDSRFAFYLRVIPDLSYGPLKRR